MHLEQLPVDNSSARSRIRAGQVVTGIPQLFDRRILNLRRNRVSKDSADSDFLYEASASEIANRVGIVSRQFNRCVDLGANNSRLQNALDETPNVRPVVPATSNLNILYNSEVSGVGVDEEALPFANSSIDLIASNLQLQFVNDLPGTLSQIQHALKPDGLFVASLFGRGTLSELRDSFIQAETELSHGVSPHIAPLPDVRDMGSLLQRAGFALPVVDVDTIKVRYPNPIALMHDLRKMGAANALSERSKSFLRRDVFQRTLEVYSQRYGEADGKIPATFNIVYISGWHPHESQQQPLRPGSARTSLADALNTREIKLPRNADTDGTDE